MTYNTASSAAIFTASRAPYVKYLSAIKRDEARTMEHDLRTGAASAKQSDAPGSKRVLCANTIAEIRDIEVHTGGKDDNVLTYTYLTDEGLEVPKPETVARFLNRLDDCKSNVHTRIIILHGDRTFLNGRTKDGLLFCHILGAILDLSLYDVCFLAQLNTPAHHGPKQLQRVPMKPGFVSLGGSAHDKNRGAAAYLGRRRLGNHSPHVVVIRLQQCYYESEDLPWASVGSVCEPPSYLEHMSGRRSSLDRYCAGSFFCRALRHCLRSTPPLQEGEITGSWMSALIYMDAIMRARSIEYLASQWPDTSKSFDINELRQFYSRTNETLAEIQTSVNQVAASSNSFSWARQSDYHEAYHFLERLLDQAKSMVREIKETLDTQHQIKSFEVSSLAVHESKSAIALTVLAFIFIPINTASSVYA